MSNFVSVLDDEQQDNFFQELSSYWESHPHEIVKENGISKLAENVLETSDHSFLKKLRETLGKLSKGLGNQDVQIYRLKKNSSLSIKKEPLAIMRLILVVGSQGFLETELPHSGKSTGRGGTYIRLLKSGEAYIPKDEDIVRLSGKNKESVFIKGKGRVPMTKETPFDQFVFTISITFDMSRLETLQKQLLGGGADSIFKDKVVQDMFKDMTGSEFNEEDMMNALEAVKGEDNEGGVTEQSGDALDEFMA